MNMSLAPSTPMNKPHSPIVIVTGASSGVGLYATASLIQQGWHVVMACRDLAKAQRVAAEMQLPAGHFTPMHLDLGSLQSVRDFVAAYSALGWPLHALLNNAASYQPRLKDARPVTRRLRTERGHQPLGALFTEPFVDGFAAQHPSAGTRHNNRLSVRGSSPWAP